MYYAQIADKQLQNNIYLKLSYKSHFKVVVDGMPSKQICYFVINSYKKTIFIKNKEYILDKVSTLDITKHRKAIINEAVRYL